MKKVMGAVALALAGMGAQAALVVEDRTGEPLQDGLTRVALPHHLIGFGHPYQSLGDSFTSGPVTFSGSGLAMQQVSYISVDVFGERDRIHVPAMTATQMFGALAGEFNTLVFAIRNLNEERQFFPTAPDLGDPAVNFSFTTNLGSYSYRHDDPGRNFGGYFGNSQPLSFTVGPAEYFTGFSLQGVPGSGHGFGFTGMGVGNVAVMTPAVPEPETYALMLAGLIAVGAAVRRKASR